MHRMPFLASKRAGVPIPTAEGGGPTGNRAQDAHMEGERPLRCLNTWVWEGSVPVIGWTIKIEQQANCLITGGRLVNGSLWKGVTKIWNCDGGKKCLEGTVGRRWGANCSHGIRALLMLATNSTWPQQPWEFNLRRSLGFENPRKATDSWHQGWAPSLQIFRPNFGTIRIKKVLTAPFSVNYYRMAKWKEGWTSKLSIFLSWLVKWHPYQR